MSGNCQTMDDTAGKLWYTKTVYIKFIFVVAWTDYDPINGSYFVTKQKPMTCEHITIKDNPYHDGNRKLFFTLSNEYGEDVWVEICIWDDEWGMLQIIICEENLPFGHIGQSDTIIHIS